MSLLTINGDLIKQLIDSINEHSEATKDHAQALRVLAASGNCMSELIEESIQQKKPTAVVADQTAINHFSDAVESVEATKKEIKVTLIELRERLAKITDKDKVKGLIQKYGALKLTDIDPANFAKLYEESEALI